MWEGGMRQTEPNGRTFAPLQWPLHEKNFIAATKTWNHLLLFHSSGSESKKEVIIFVSTKFMRDQ